MDPLWIGFGSAALLVLALLLGVPVAPAMGLIGIGGMLASAGFAFTAAQLRGLPYAVVANYDFAVLPLFVLMGVLAEASGITAQLFHVLDLWLRRVRGGLYQAVVLGSAIFAAVSGSTIVNAVVFTRIAYPQMLRYGYDRALSIGCIAATGSFAAMIPPSITMVIYAIMTGQSVGRLLIAGIVPGVLTAAVYFVGIAVLMRLKPSLAPPAGAAVATRERWQKTAALWPLLLLIVPVIGGLYAGLYPASAAGAVGAFCAFGLALAKRRGSRGWLPPVLQDAAAISCTIFAILIGGLLLSRMLVVSGVIDQMVLAITSIASTPLRFMLLACLLYGVLGCLLDTTSMMVVTLPFLYPVVVALKIDPIWFGIVLVKLIEISVVTPPVGVNLFAVLGAAGKETQVRDVLRGVAPFIALELLVLALLVAVPSLSTWLPDQMMSYAR
ncbi:MAG: TRAP transporter large permease subunit [Pseudomonadota bacterium]|nr:TRAP transporter large permease subunit [Pseudomonadota bacterium]